MKLRYVTFSLILICCLGAEPTTGPSYPDSKDGLTQLFKDILAASAANDQAKVSALFKSTDIPDPAGFFKQVFGDDNGKKLTAEYNKDMKTIAASLANLFMNLKDPANLAITVDRFEVADDPDAKVYQRIAMQAMQDPVPLYTVTVSKPGTTASISLWSMVYIDGTFRFAGKMRAIKSAATQSSDDQHGQ